MYLIPVNINKKFEFFPGFGFKELFLMGGFGIIGFGIAFLIGLVSPHPARFLPVLLFGGVGFLLAKPQEGSMTGFDMLIYVREFMKSQKIYLYERR